MSFFKRKLRELYWTVTRAVGLESIHGFAPDQIFLTFVARVTGIGFLERMSLNQIIPFLFLNSRSPLLSCLARRVKASNYIILEPLRSFPA